MNSEFKCPFCAVNSQTVLNLKLEEHVLSNHISTLSKIYSCHDCSLSFFNLANYQMHKNKMHASKASEILTVYNIRKATIETKIIVNKDDPKPNDKKVVPKPNDNCYTCKKCGESVSKKLYTDHINSHAYKCPYCTVLLASSELIKSHLGLNVNANTKCYEYHIKDPSINNITSAVFTKTYLETVTRISEDLNNRCKVCYKYFRFHCQLSKHQKLKKHI
jgi:hypothetical protein